MHYADLYFRAIRNNRNNLRSCCNCCNYFTAGCFLRETVEVTLSWLCPMQFYYCRKYTASIQKLILQLIQIRPHAAVLGYESFSTTDIRRNRQFLDERNWEQSLGVRIRRCCGGQLLSATVNFSRAFNDKPVKSDRLLTWRWRWSSQNFTICFF